MRFLQHDQIIGLEGPPKSQTRRLKFPYPLARSLWKFGWRYADPRYYYRPGPQPQWEDHLAQHSITDEHIADANRILATYRITLPVQPGRGKKAVGRTPPIRAIRQERLGDISEEDCLAEGVIYHPDKLAYGGIILAHFHCPICQEEWGIAQIAYACLWNHCGGNWEKDKDKQCWVLDWGER